MIQLFYPIISIGFILGASIALATPLYKTPALYLAIAIGIISVFLFLFRKYSRTVLAFVLILSFLFGVFRVEYSSYGDESPLSSIYGKEVSVEGIIVRSISHSDSKSKYTLDVSKINNVLINVPVYVLVFESYPTSCVLGEKVSLKGIINEPEDFITNTGRIFRYKKYLSQQDVYGNIFIDEGDCIGYSHKTEFFSKIRSVLVSAIHNFLPINEASLLVGLLLGVRSTFSPELFEAFRITGLLHIVVLSGYNITIVAEAIRRIFSRFSRRVSTTASIISIALFVLLAGAQTAAVRAGAMGSIGLFARALYREYLGIRILIIVGAAMVLYEPLILFHSSFHLSFLATFALLAFAPFFEERLWWITDKFQFRSIVAVTVATQVFLLPYLAYAIGEVSLIAIITNVLILPLVPLAMLFGAIVGLIAVVSPSLAIILSPLSYIPLAYMTHSVEWFARIPYATVPLFHIPWWAVVIVYIVISFYIMRFLKD